MGKYASPALSSTYPLSPQAQVGDWPADTVIAPMLGVCKMGVAETESGQDLLSC